MRLPDLVLFNVTVVVGVRWVAVAARTGPGSITLWVGGCVCCFSFPPFWLWRDCEERYPEEGGLYVWAREAFGPWHGFLCGACYFVSNLFFFPVVLLYGLSIAALAFGFSQDKALMIGLALAILSSRCDPEPVGSGVGKMGQRHGRDRNHPGRRAAHCSGLVGLEAGRLRQRRCTTWCRGLDWEKLNFWSQIALGIDRPGTGRHVAGEIRNPVRTIPRAAWMSGLAICVFYVGGTLALLVLGAFRPDGHYRGGDASRSGRRSTRLGWQGFPLLIALLILAAAVGAFGSWLSGCARLPFVIGIDRYLPPAFARLHPRWRTPYVALLAEATFTSVAIVLMMAGESLRGGYQIPGGPHHRHHAVPFRVHLRRRLEIRLAREHRVRARRHGPGAGGGLYPAGGHVVALRSKDDRRMRRNPDGRPDELSVRPAASQTGGVKDGGVTMNADRTVSNLEVAREGPIAVITLNRPERRNALSLR